MAWTSLGYSKYGAMKSKYVSLRRLTLFNLATVTSEPRASSELPTFLSHNDTNIPHVYAIKFCQESWGSLVDVPLEHINSIFDNKRVVPHIDNFGQKQIYLFSMMNL